MTGIGALLESARKARGLTLEEAAAATRIRLRQLRALESDDFAALGAPVYVRGHLRAYAAFLDLEAGDLIAHYDARLGKGGRNLAFRPLAGLHAPSAIVVTAPIAGAIGALLLVIAFTGYIYRSLDSVRVVPPAPGPVATALPSPSPSPSAPGAPAAAPALSPQPAPVPSPTPSPRRVSLAVTATDTVWIDVAVDGKAQFGDAGKVLEAGSSLTFNGLQKVRVTSGRGGATQVSVNGKPSVPLGSGVVTREFTPQS